MKFTWWDKTLEEKNITEPILFEVLEINQSAVQIFDGEQIIELSVGEETTLNVYLEFHKKQRHGGVSIYRYPDFPYIVALTDVEEF